MGGKGREFRLCVSCVGRSPSGGARNEGLETEIRGSGRVCCSSANSPSKVRSPPPLSSAALTNDLSCSTLVRSFPLPALRRCENPMAKAHRASVSRDPFSRPHSTSALLPLTTQFSRLVSASFRPLVSRSIPTPPSPAVFDRRPSLPVRFLTTPSAPAPLLKNEVDFRSLRHRRPCRLVRPRAR